MLLDIVKYALIGLIITAPIGIAIWSFQGKKKAEQDLADEKIRRHPLNDQPVLVGDMRTWWKDESEKLCKKYITETKFTKLCLECQDKCNKKRNEEREKEMSQIVAAIKEEFERGNKKFENTDQLMYKMTDTMAKMGESVAVLASQVRELRNEKKDTAGA